ITQESNGERLETIENAPRGGRMKPVSPSSRRHRQIHRVDGGPHLVLIGICTHLGCIPEFKPVKGGIAPDWPGGYFCPCHGSRYDLAGRVFQGVPAPYYNLPVPPCRFIDDTTLSIGDNPPGSAFKVNEIVQT
ncbi:MAG: ubiquinol-cytochrome c reductase iron-sulfur subunit, partial [Sphingomonadales bacterium]|nr:ubiquinol-cytochrome c reductase iron-sulfur subunit [Sphingomonadales bacterium]